MQKIDKTDTLEVILTRGRLEVDYYQREYRWGRKQIEQMLMDFYDTFRLYYDAGSHGSTKEVQNYGFYYMGSIICTNGNTRQIIDGQQRLTSLTLLLIYLQNLQKEAAGIPFLPVEFSNLIYKDDYGTMAFNIDVPERNGCMQAIWGQNAAYIPDNESNKNLLARYGDIEDLFPDELKGQALPYFIYWLKSKVLLLEIDTPSEDEAHRIFLTMNDRGLSLNSAEMLKAFMVQQVEEEDRGAVNKAWQQNITKIKNAFDSGSSGAVKAEDVDFISTWLRAKYADSIRETKKGAEDQDFELLGERFHTWVRQNARVRMKLVQPKQYKELITLEMSLMANLYLRVKEYSEKFTKGYEAVFYNAHRNITYQNYLILAAVCVDDPVEAIDQKIKMVAAFIDIFASIRIFNYKKVNWNTNKALLFRVMVQIRNQDVKAVGIKLTAALQRMPERLDAIKDFVLNQFTGRYMLHMLARMTDYVNIRMGYAPQFPVYIDRDPKTSYDIEHILPDDFATYADLFNDEEDFLNNRQKIGNLMILTLDHNRSYQNMPYAKKVKHYISDNILAQALNSGAYANNPKFLALKEEFGFQPYDETFDKGSIRGRAKLYANLAKAVWNPQAIRDLAGGWDEEEEISIRSGSGRRFTVEYSNGRSWEDAREKGFVSACAATASNNKLMNVHVGDYIFCHIQGKGFVGVGVCTCAATAPEDFYVKEGGATKPIMKCKWIDPQEKAGLNVDNEYFLGVKWFRTVPMEEGYWERGMVSLPMVAYLMNDESTHNKVLKHFHITLR
ncbi:MAG: DUF262 domain-containing protein [Lachnospiraceae bacterium]|nr:DUF262 domain-containing protein [Lachnospiraceae bacterium]